MENRLFQPIASFKLFQWAVSALYRNFSSSLIFRNRPLKKFETRYRLEYFWRKTRICEKLLKPMASFKLFQRAVPEYQRGWKSSIQGETAQWKSLKLAIGWNDYPQMQTSFPKKVLLKKYSKLKKVFHLLDQLNIILNSYCNTFSIFQLLFK